MPNLHNASIALEHAIEDIESMRDDRHPLPLNGVVADLIDTEAGLRNALAQGIRALLVRIDALERRVQELESREE